MRIAVCHIERLPSPIVLQLLQVSVHGIVPRCPAMADRMEEHAPRDPSFGRYLLERPVELRAGNTDVGMPQLTIYPPEAGAAQMSSRQRRQGRGSARHELDDAVLHVAGARLDVPQRDPAVLELDIFSSPG